MATFYFFQLILISLFLLGACAAPLARNPADFPPRKVLIGTTMKHFSGDLQARLATAGALIDAVAARAARDYPGVPLDLVVLPETAIVASGRGAGAPTERAVPLEGAVLETFAAAARRHRTHVVIPMLLRERPAGAKEDVLSNVAVVLDREGRPIGTYRKVFSVTNPGAPRNGVTPGDAFAVIACDFGRIGIQICWDMSYDDGFEALAKRGAEIVLIPSASPQTVRPAAHALRHRYYVVTSTPRDNATIFSPIGTVLAQTTRDEALVHQVDLSYALLHWSAKLEDGKAFTRAFGDRAGFVYSTREDTGVFWSNDPGMTVGQMCRELGVVDLATQIDVTRRERDELRPPAPVQ